MPFIVNRFVQFFKEDIKFRRKCNKYFSLSPERKHFQSVVTKRATFFLQNQEEELRNHGIFLLINLQSCNGTPVIDQYMS